jgi:hypothetical protein
MRKCIQMKTTVLLLIFLPGIILVGQGKMTPLAYQNTTMPQFSEYLQDEIPSFLIEEILK